MISSIKAEFRKLLTVRSTYGITLSILALIGLLATVNAYKGAAHFAPSGLQTILLNDIAIAEILGGIAAILLITQEYRYNTIDYSLTNINRRLKLVIAKLVTVTCYALVLTGVAGVAIWGFTLLGIHLHGMAMPPQHIAFTSMAGKMIAFTVSGIWAGLLFGFLCRSVVMAIVLYFLMPTMIEPLLHTLVKISNNYLPFAAQNQITMTSHIKGAFSPLASLGVFLAYLAGGWVVALILFYRRDAN